MQIFSCHDIMIALSIIPILFTFTLIFSAYLNLKCYMGGLGIGETVADHLDVVISGIGYFYFNTLIFSFVFTFTLCCVAGFLLFFFITKKRTIYRNFFIIFGVIALLFPYFSNPAVLDPQKSAVQRQSLSLPRVAHAGGGYREHTYTNSLNALEANKNLYSLFEIDFSWTTDGHLVCLHDWDINFRHFFNLDFQGPVSLEYFLELVNQHKTFKKCTLEYLIIWLDNNPHARIVTDIKEENLRGLEMITEHYPEYSTRFIPQVYQPGEYYIVKNMGYDDVILTLYAYHGSDEDVLYWLRHMDLFGLAMPRFRADRGLARQAIETTGVLSWVHTINNQDEYEKYLAKGADNVYTDWLVP